MENYTYPVVSVIMSVYNSEAYIADAIMSIVSQTYDSWELIITDDCSTDNTVNIINSISDQRIRIIQNTENKGLTSNLINMQALCRGKYIARLDADDISRPDRLQKQVEVLEKNDKLDMVCSYASAIGDKKGIIKYPANEEHLKASLLFGNSVIHSSVMFRNESALKYSKEFRKSQDYDLWDRMIANRKHFFIIKEPLVSFRFHNEQISNCCSSEQNFFSDEVKKRAYFRLGIKMSETEERIIFEFLDRKRVASVDEVDIIINFLKRLQTNGTKSDIYAKKFIRKSVSRQFLQLTEVVKTLKIKLNFLQKCEIFSHMCSFYIIKVRFAQIIHEFLSRK